MTTTNDDLIIDVLAQIERDPKSWDQARWGTRAACGTSYCFAGWALAFNDVPLRWEPFAGKLDAYGADLTADGRLIDAAAADLLGLTYEQAIGLFHPMNTLDELYRHAAKAMGVDLIVLLDKVQDRLAA